jgi:hypothetical protein
MAIGFRIKAEHLMTGTCVIYKMMTLGNTIYFDWQGKYSNWWFQNCGNYNHQTLGKHSLGRNEISFLVKPADILFYYDNTVQAVASLAPWNLDWT